MIFASVDNFYLTDEELAASPSRADGVAAAAEEGLRHYGCDVIQEAGVLLRLPQAVMATAQVLLHRFYCKRSLAKFDVKVCGGRAGAAGAGAGGSGPPAAPPQLGKLRPSRPKAAGWLGGLHAVCRQGRGSRAAALAGSPAPPPPAARAGGGHGRVLGRGQAGGGD